MKNPKIILAAAASTVKAFDFTGTLTINASATDGDKRPSFDLEAYNGGAIRVGYWGHPVVIDGNGVQTAGALIPIYATHEKSFENLLGQTGEVSAGNTGKIKSKGKFTAERETSRPYAQMMDHNKNGYKWQVSIGASADEYEFVKEGQSVKVNGQTFQGPIYVVRKSTLNHIAIVELGADVTTMARIAASRGEEFNMPTFEQWLTSQDKVLANLTDDEKTRLQAAYDAMSAAGVLKPIDASHKDPEPTEKGTNDPPKTVAAAASDDPVATMRKNASVEAKRISEITAATASHPDIRAKAIDLGWNLDKTELEVIKASHKPVSSGRGTPNTVVSDEVIEAAIILKHNSINGHDNLMAAYGESAGRTDAEAAKILNAADKIRNVPMTKLIERICASRGIVLPETLGGDYIKAAFSTTALSGILGNVANKTLNAAFRNVNQVAPIISKPRSHMNFHSHTCYSLAISGDLEEVGARGELKHGNLSEESYTRQLKTRGMLLSISRQDAINGMELGAFIDATQRLGRKCALSREKVTFKLINGTGAGASFFTSARGNYFSGATSALSETSLATADQMLMDQKGPDGNPIGILAKYLLLPTALKVTGKKLVDPNSTSMIVSALGSTASAKLEPSKNIFAGALIPLVSEWLSVTQGTSVGSSTAFYVMGDPMDVAAVEISYLNGNQSPIIEFFGEDSDPSVLGVSWRAYYDFGVDLAEYRAAVKSKGAA